MFVLDDELARQDTELCFLDGVARLVRLATLAWHLRQRDITRARQLMAQARPLMAALPEAALAIRPRFVLVEAEAEWLAGRLQPARALAMQALAGFTACADAAGRADAHWLLAWIAVDGGEIDASETALDMAAAAARAAGDSVRLDVIDAGAAILGAFRDRPSATSRWSGRFSADLARMPRLAAGWIGDFFGIAAFLNSDFGAAIRHLVPSYDIAMASGQRRRAIILASNIGNAFTSLNAHDLALEWMQRGLDLARPSGWPLCLGISLIQTGETLRQMRQLAAARALLDEALGILSTLSGSRAYAVALEYQGDLALDLGDHDAALRSFALLQERAEMLGQSDFQSGARRGQAHALSQLDRPREALTVAAAALLLARRHEDVYTQISALKVLADIHVRHGQLLPDPPAMAAPSSALHYLQQALELAATIDGYTVPGSLLDAVAREYATVGDYQAAYHVALRASAARDQTHGQDATNRAIAMQVQYQTERAHTLGEHHRQLAASEAQRAEVLQRTSAMLAHLSAIGQEITAHLDAEAVFRALDRHVHGLLDATHFSVLLLEGGELGGSTGPSHLYCAFGIETGKILPRTRVALADGHKNSVRCMRERREILVDIGPEVARPNLIPGTLPTLSLLFAPLLIGERVLGVMTVQSMQRDAYGERERLIFRTLCAYGAIALDNASAYRQVAATLKALNATQAQLLEKNLELERAYGVVKEISLTDQLTGMHNRRFFLQNIDADIAMSLRAHDDALRDGVPGVAQHNDLVFFMVDLDHFKEVNDQYGHSAGDAVLMQMHERLGAVFRESDYLIRWGGEEFLVLARATRRDQAGMLAERIRAEVANRPFLLPDGVSLARTCSIGFACFPFLPSQPRLLSWSQVVELADQSLYLAKKAGRDGWAALYGAAVARPEGLFARLLQDLEQSVRDGDAVLHASTQPAQIAGQKIGIKS